MVVLIFFTVDAVLLLFSHTNLKSNTFTDDAQPKHMLSHSLKHRHGAAA